MRTDTAFLFDLDGTLVDSVYQHVLAWKESLDEEGIDLSVWRIHRKIGMSGGLFTNQLLRETGLEITAERVDRLRQRHAAAYQRRSAAIRPLPGARELLAALTALRKGDMLQDFFGNFREMHEAVRKRMQTDVITMEGAESALRSKAGGDAKLTAALDELTKHLTQRKKQLL